MEEGVVLVKDLKVELAESELDIVDEVSFNIYMQGRYWASWASWGSGKTTVAMSLLGHARKGTRIANGEVRICGQNILQISTTEKRRIRGNIVSYMPQDPSRTLNPALRLRIQLEETLDEHLGQLSRQERSRLLAQVLDDVMLPKDAGFLKRYPHQLSGGQQQRVLLAMAFICKPRLILLDEPTTGLDVTTQAHILETVRELCRAHNASALYVTHDLAVVAELVDDVAVMYAGRIVENGPKREIFTAPMHPYTRELLRSIPDVSGRSAITGIPGRAVSIFERPQGCSFAPRCKYVISECLGTPPPMLDFPGDHSVSCYRAQLDRKVRVDTVFVGAESNDLGQKSVELKAKSLTAWFGTHQVLSSIDLELRSGECLALVGELGSGKTTAARCIAGIHKKVNGDLRLQGKALPFAAKSRSKRDKQAIQIVFQNPDSSLNPRQTVGQIVSRPLSLFFGIDRRDARERVIELLDQVMISPSLIDSYPDELSGGEKQRVAIARALAADPSVLICDEITSALDVSVQATIVELLQELQSEMGLALLFITHNLALVSSIAQQVTVIKNGLLVETGPFADVFFSTQEAYTRELLDSTPSISRAS